MSDDFESAIIGAIYNYGRDVFIDCDDIVNTDSFTNINNQLIYKCYQEIFKTNVINIDVPTLLSTANVLGFKDKIDINYLQQCIQIPVEKENIRKFAASIRKLEIARSLKKVIKKCLEKLDNVKGEETLTTILNVVENPIFDFSLNLREENNGPSLLGANIDKFIEHKILHKNSMLGISTGYLNYDLAIGGGLRRKTINLIGARPKTGKTFFGINVALNISKTGVPVLYLDTEMSLEDQQSRSLACLSNIDINDIETGTFADDLIKLDNIKKGMEIFKLLPLSYINISGQPFEDTIATMRRWILKQVGFDNTGNIKNAVIILDYLKLMNSDGLSSSMQEYQKLGFIITAMHNFAVKYDVPILSFIQLNRDGINKESTDTASGSDRLIWLCSNFSIFKKKEQEEIDLHGPQWGNRKLIPVVARHGEGLQDGDYINMIFNGRRGQLLETAKKSDIINGMSFNDNMTWEINEYQ